jgi:pyruvate-formate lyase-activating enzyme
VVSLLSGKLGCSHCQNPDVQQYFLRLLLIVPMSVIGRLEYRYAQSWQALGLDEGSNAPLK